LPAPRARIPTASVAHAANSKLLPAETVRTLAPVLEAPFRDIGTASFKKRKLGAAGRGGGAAFASGDIACDASRFFEQGATYHVPISPSRDTGSERLHIQQRKSRQTHRKPRESRRRNDWRIDQSPERSPHLKSYLCTSTSPIFIAHQSVLQETQDINLRALFEAGL